MIDKNICSGTKQLTPHNYYMIDSEAAHVNKRLVTVLRWQMSIFKSSCDKDYVTSLPEYN